MKAKLLNEQNEKIFALIFSSGDEVIASLLQFAKENHLDAAHFTAIGGLSDVMLDYFDRERKTYEKIPPSLKLRPARALYFLEEDDL